MNGRHITVNRVGAAAGGGGGAAAGLTPATHMEFIVDFIEGGDIGVAQSAASGGAAAYNTSQVTADHPGIVQLSTGTGSTNYVSKYLNRFMVGSTLIYEAGIRIEDLADATDDYIIQVGLNFDNTLSSNPHGYFFEYNRGTSSNWLTCSARNPTSTKTESSTAVAADEWLRMRIEVAADLSQAEYFINGTSIGVNTTNIPLNSVFMYPLVGIRKTAGTTARLLYCDYIYVNLSVTR